VSEVLLADREGGDHLRLVLGHEAVDSSEKGFIEGILVVAGIHSENVMNERIQPSRPSA
jgi:hypothetical protein